MAFKDTLHDSTTPDLEPKASKQSYDQDPFPRFSTTETPELAYLSSTSDSDEATIALSKGGGESKAKRKRARRRAKQGVATGSTPFLRPANDVLNRLRHDSSFNQSDYIVGYTDRFEGLKTMNVQEWGKDTEDEEFIAEHRIEYFKRVADDHVVWHRKDKIDEIFWTGMSGIDQSAEDD